jgi:hypothetical protein
MYVAGNSGFTFLRLIGPIRNPVLAAEDEGSYGVAIFLGPPVNLHSLDSNEGRNLGYSKPKKMNIVVNGKKYLTIPPYAVDNIISIDPV